MDFDDTPEEAQFRAKARAWLEEHKAQGSRIPRGEMGAMLDANATKEQVKIAREWQRTLYEGGWIGITWPKEYGGQGGTPMQEVIFDQELDKAGLLGPMDVIALGFAGHTILALGTEEQKKQFIPAILKAEILWCQLFSEPAAGSDLAGLETKAVRDGDDFIVNGQKVWNSGAHYADWAILVTRTDPNVPKHSGLTYFLLDMKTPGITVRPLKQITGGAAFNEVFLDNVRVPAKNILGREGGGWQVALTTLGHERMANGGGGTGITGGVRRYIDLIRSCKVRGRSALEDSAVRQELAKVISEDLAVRYGGYRRLSAISQGKAPGPEGACGKYMSTDLRQHAVQLALAVQGVAGTVMEGSEHAMVNGMWQTHFLEAPGGRIAGGTDEILKNIVGERVLGLPGEPRIDKGIPFKDLPRGTMQ